jgi:hypothetical protein
MKFPDFEKELAVFRTHLETAYAQGFDDAADAILAGAQARVMGQPQPELPLRQPNQQPASRQRNFAPRGWTKAEDDFLREAWGKLPFRELSKTYERSPSAIRLRGQKLGLERLPINYQFTGGKT